MSEQLICNFYNYCNRHLCAFIGGIKNNERMHGATIKVTNCSCFMLHGAWYVKIMGCVTRVTRYNWVIQWHSFTGSDDGRMTVHVPPMSDVSMTLMDTHPCRYHHDVAWTNITHDTDHKEAFEYLNEIHQNQSDWVFKNIRMDISIIGGTHHTVTTASH